MAKRKDKHKTPEQKAAQKAAHAARERERYALAKKAGLSRTEARSLKKSIDQLPDILKDPSEGILDLIGGVRGLADSLFKFGKEITTGQLPEIAPEKPSRKTKDYSSFLDFLAGNPGLSANKAIKKFRSQGGKVGNETGKELFREQRGKAKQIFRKTRFKYVSNEEKPVFGDKKLIKDRYMYLMQYEMQMEEGTDRTDWMYIASPDELTLRELKEAVLQQWQDWKDGNGGNERYKSIRIIPQSIELIHAIDTTL